MTYLIQRKWIIRFYYLTCIKKIRPTAGKLAYSIHANDFKIGRYIDYFWISLNLKPFDFLDPFYGPMKKEEYPNGLYLDFEFDNRDVKVSSPYALKGIHFKSPANSLYGSFSNSLSVVVTELKFVSLINRSMIIEMEYYITGSDSYGYNLSGNEELHSKIRSRLTTTVYLEDAVLYLKRPLPWVLRKILSG